MLSKQKCGGRGDGNGVLEMSSDEASYEKLARDFHQPQKTWHSFKIIWKFTTVDSFMECEGSLCIFEKEQNGPGSLL